MRTGYCDRCRQRMPEHTINQIITNAGSNRMCAICALKDRNAAHGLPLETAFTGTQAHAMFVDAVIHLGERAPKWAQRVVAKGKAEPMDAEKIGGKYVSTMEGVPEAGA